MARAFLTSAFPGAGGDMVMRGEEEEEVEGTDWCGGRASEVGAVLVVLTGGLGSALLLCAVSCFPGGPPPFCDGFCLITFSSSIWESAVPWAKPKSTSAYLHLHTQNNENLPRKCYPLH